MDGIFDVGGFGQYLNNLPPVEKAIRLEAFFQILAGKKASIYELAFRTGLTAEKMKHHIKNMTVQGLLVTDEQDSVVGSHGLSLIPTEHHLRISGLDLFTWCAADAIGIPAVLEANAKVVSKCFVCNELIYITIANGQVQHANLEDIRLWVIEADFGRSIVGCA